MSIRLCPKRLLSLSRGHSLISRRISHVLQCVRIPFKLTVSSISSSLVPSSATISLRSFASSVDTFNDDNDDDERREESSRNKFTIVDNLQNGSFSAINDSNIEIGDLNISRQKAGTPSPWAVFDAWGAGNDSMECSDPLSSEEEYMLSPESVRISGRDDSGNENDVDTSDTEILNAYDKYLQQRSSVHSDILIILCTIIKSYTIS